MTWRARQPTAALLFFTTSGLFGCASTPVDSPHASAARLIADHWPTWADGEPSDTPPPPVTSAFPNVSETPPSRPLRVLSAAQQTKAIADLDALRGRVARQVRAAEAFDESNTATALTELIRGQVATAVPAPANEQPRNDR